MSKYEQLFIATTDTVPGIGAPMTKANLDAIYELKMRDRSKPVVVMVGSIEQAKAAFDREFNSKAMQYAKEYWPGATTLILNDELALRMPDNEALCHFILQTGGPIWMTSANISGQKPLTFEEAKETFQEIKQFFDFGKGSGRPSQLINVNTGEVIKR